MPDSKKVKDGAVSSIGDADLVMCAVGGKYHPISFANLMAAVRGGIQVGGRNLISNIVYDNSIAGARETKGVRINRETRFQFTTAPIKEEGEYAYSFWAKADSPTSIHVDVNDCSYATFEVGTEWTFLCGTSRVVKYLASHGFIDITSQESMIDKVIVSDITVVKGNIPPSSWTPAPEDIASGLWGGNCKILKYLQFHSERRCA